MKRAGGCGFVCPECTLPLSSASAQRCSPSYSHADNLAYTVIMKIALEIESVRLIAKLTDSPVARALVEILPAQARLSRWGDEYYGAIGLSMPNDPKTRKEVEIGTLAYWPTGDALCIFFGPTPMSTGDTPRAASPVTVIGSVVEGEVTELRNLASSVNARLEGM